MLSLTPGGDKQQTKMSQFFLPLTLQKMEVTIGFQYHIFSVTLSSVTFPQGSVCPLLYEHSEYHKCS